MKLQQLKKHGNFARSPFGEIPNGASLIEGRFAYAIKNKPLSEGYEKTDAYIDESKKLDAGFRVNGFQELVGKMQQRTQYNYKA